MLRATLSILGLYQWNSDIFDGLELPEEMDKETAITEILSQCAELELVYPSYDVMKKLITNWARIELPIWERVYRDCTIEYNPIWNKDGKITDTETRDLHVAKEGSGTQTIKNDYTDTSVTQPIENTTTTEPIENTTTTEPIENTTTNSIKGYNQDNQVAWNDSEKTTQNLGETTTTQNLGETTTTQNLGKVDNTFTHKTDENTTTDNRDYHDRDYGTVTHTIIEQGNIGVTKTTELLSDDLALLPELNPYQFVVNSFKKRFCLLVY